MKLGYLILAHESYSDLKVMLDCLSFYPDDHIFLHHDKKSKYNQEMSVHLDKYHNLSLIENIKVEWGEASIVYATLKGIELALTTDIDYLILLSGSCMPITTRAHLVRHLELTDGDFIECHDPAKGRWVKDGLEKERWEHFNFFNWRKDPLFFSLSHKFQTKFRIKRKFPGGVIPVLGSQWWCLKKDTLNKIISFKKKYKAEGFIKNSWIPDEFFIQSIVYSINNNNFNHDILMHYRFNDVGIPKVFTLTDLEELIEINKTKFFARKVDKRDLTLKCFLSSLYCESNLQGEISPENVGSDFKILPSKKKYIIDKAAPDYLYPIYIILFDEVINKELTDFFKRLNENLNLHFYGELFSQFKIDYGFEKHNPLYDQDDMPLRDYALREFSAQVLNKNSESIFVVNIHDFDKAHYAIQNFSNIKFVFPAFSYNKYSLESTSRIFSIKKYIKSEGYDVLFDNDPDSLISKIQSDINKSSIKNFL